MRHQIGFIALSLLAAALAGCSSTKSTPTQNDQEPFTGPLAMYNGSIVPLQNPCTWDSSNGSVLSVKLAANELVAISVRASDKAMLVNGQQCQDVATSKNKGAALSSKIKAITIGPQRRGDRDP